MITSAAREVQWDISDTIPVKVGLKKSKPQPIDFVGATSLKSLRTVCTALVLAAAVSGSVSPMPYATNVRPVIERITAERADKAHLNRADFSSNSIADTDVGMSTTRLAGLFPVIFGQPVDPDLELGSFSLD